MFHQRALYLEWADTVAGRFDHIVDTAYKPIIAVGVADGYIAGVVKAVVHGLCFYLRVVEIFAEEAGGASVIDTDNYLALFAVGHGITLRIDNVDVIERSFLSHRAGARLYPRICAYGEGSLGLAKTFHQRYAGEPLPFLENGWIEGLTGYCAISQCREVIAAHILADKEAEDCGRGAE